jgi:hypothetical protein
METYVKLYASRVQSLKNIGWKIEDDTIQVCLIDSIKEPSWGPFNSVRLRCQFSLGMGIRFYETG